MQPVPSALQRCEKWVFMEIWKMNYTQCIPKLSTQGVDDMVKKILRAMVDFALKSQIPSSQYDSLGIATLWRILDTNPEFMRRCGTTAATEKKRRLESGQGCTSMELAYYQHGIREFLKDVPIRQTEGSTEHVRMDTSEDPPPTRGGGTEICFT